MNFLPLPPIECLRQYLAYDPDSGEINWRESPNWSIKPGDSAGWATKKGYRELRLFGQTFKAHRIAWAIKTGEDPAPFEIDHQDRCKSNNRWANLRLATRKINNENIGIPRNNTSGIKGVSWCKSKGRWHAYIYHNKRRIHLGIFKCREAAAQARSSAEASLFSGAPAGITGITGKTGVAL